MSIASGFVTRVYCLNKLSCAPQRGFFEASADCDGLECDVAWLVTALQRVVSKTSCEADIIIAQTDCPVSSALWDFHEQVRYDNSSN